MTQLAPYEINWTESNPVQIKSLIWSKNKLVLINSNLIKTDQKKNCRYKVRLFAYHVYSKR